MSRTLQILFFRVGALSLFIITLLITLELFITDISNDAVSVFTLWIVVLIYTNQLEIEDA